MSLFRKKIQGVASHDLTAEQAMLAETVLNSINDGVVIIDQNGIVKLANPAAARMTGNTSVADAFGLSYLSLIRLENGEGMAIADNQNPLAVAVANNQPFESRDFCLVTLQGARIPIALTMTPSGGRNADRIITFRNIAQELEKEGEQTEFISTASHEMRTPVASIEGYLGLALNPATATIDERARQYLTEAHKSSQHLGKLFQDLLDVTKLDDKRIKLHLVPVELVSTLREMADKQVAALNDKGLRYSFGTGRTDSGEGAQIDQLAYAMVDLDFLQEIMNNLIENAIKYSEPGGELWIGVRADGDKVLINVTDTGMGISPENLTHIFQKFYRVDNSATRTIGGTGLGLYIVKERVEAMGGRVWAESAFSEGSTFYVSFPRISEEEFQRQRQVMANVQAMTPVAAPVPVGTQLGQVAMQAVAQPGVASVAPVATTPTPVTAQPGMAPVAPVATTPTPVTAQPGAPVQVQAQAQAQAGAAAQVQTSQNNANVIQ